VFLSYLAMPVAWATSLCLNFAGILLVARVVLRYNRLAWTAVALAAFLYFLPRSGLAPVLTVSSAAVMTGIIMASARAGGLLATLVLLLVGRVLSAAPLTLDVGRWYVWRSWFVVALVIGLALWGFRNVLGKQSAFPAGALDG